MPKTDTDKEKWKMTSNKYSGTILRCLLGGSIVCIASTLPSLAQVQTTKTESHGEAVREVTVQRGEIVYLSGNTVVVKLEDGTLKEFDNVPDSVTFMVDGKPVSIRDAKVGMKLEKQTVTTTTPKVVTTVETVTGKVWQVQPPNWVILTLENGQNQKFNIPKGQKFTVDGQETDAFGLKKGMRISAQRVTEVPETVVAQQVSRTGSAPPPPPPPKADVPILVAAAPPAPAPKPVETAEAPPQKLPTTASNVPLIGLLGLLFCALSAMTMLIRTVAARYSGLRS
jgi:hypothetical protein